jgi:hypothetical protein
MNLLYERLRLQGHFRQLIDQMGTETALNLIEQALQREFKLKAQPCDIATKKPLRS